MSFFSLMEPTVIEHQVSFGTCYANLSEGVLTLGNEVIEQRWQISHGRLLPGCMRERTSIDDWVSLAMPQAPEPALPLPDEMGEVNFMATGGPFFADEAASMQVELRIPFASDSLAAGCEPRLLLIYRFQIRPASPSIVVELETLSL
jgi:hypothetical protein